MVDLSSGVGGGVFGVVGAESVGGGDM